MIYPLKIQISDHLPIENAFCNDLPIQHVDFPINESIYGPLVERQGTQGHEEATSHQDLKKLDWFKGNITGKPHISWENLW